MGHLANLSTNIQCICHLQVEDWISCFNQLTVCDENCTSHLINHLKNDYPLSILELTNQFTGNYVHSSKNWSVNPVSPNSNENEISLCIITTCSNSQMTRIKEVFTKDKISLDIQTNSPCYM